MVAQGDVALRRTWPQRLVIVAAMALIVASLGAAWFVRALSQGLSEVPRVAFGSDVIRTETVPGAPVNFLLVGTDSALGIPGDDPALAFRDVDPEGKALADSINLLRVDPTSGQAWMLSIPRDLYVDIPGAAPNRINAALEVGGPELLVQTVSELLDVEVNHYVQVDFLGFREVVDVLGGVPVWFDNPTRSVRSGLNVAVPGCHVLDGEEALQYVRARTDYQEFVDGGWVTTGGDDFERVARQQDFLVLALERAIDRGARNPSTLNRLLGAAEESVVLDDRLTVGELVDLGQAFSDFQPANLERFPLQPYLATIELSDGRVVEQLVREPAEPVLDIFRGVADGVAPADIDLLVVGDDPAEVTDAATVLAGSVGFGSVETGAVDDVGEHSVVVHPEGERGAALTVARYLVPKPALVEDDDVDRVVLVVGDEYEAVNWFAASPVEETEEAVAALGDVDVPDLDAVVAAPAPAAGSPVSGGTDAAAPTTTTTTPTTTTTVPTAATIRGAPPEGERCG